MGAYIYRVTARMIKLASGKKAHVAEYAYKPWNGWDTSKLNARLHFKSGCVASERLKLKSELVVTFDDHEHTGRLWHNPQGLRVFYDDDTFGTARMPRLCNLERTAPLVDQWRQTPE
jgi:hypothetical protein